MFNLRGLLQDEEFLVAAGLLQQGSQGKGIGEAFFPAIAQAGQAKKLFQSTAKKTKSVLNLVLYSVTKFTYSSFPIDL